MFDTAVLVLGALLMAGALLSGVAGRSFLSLTALFVLAGFALGHGGLDVLKLAPSSAFVRDLAVVALIVILFRDGLEVEAEMLQTAWRPPLSKLVVAMPITGATVALATHLFTDLSWTQSFLVGALLSPSVSVTTTWTRPAPSVAACGGMTLAAAGNVALIDVGPLTWKSASGSA